MTPKQAGYHQPAEWAPHSATWLAWPFDGSLWRESLHAAQREFIGLCEAIAWTPDGEPDEVLHVLAPDPAHAVLARFGLEGLPVTLHEVPFGDIWMRDIAPIFLCGHGGVASAAFGFNGWGGKWILPGDDQVARAVQRLDGRRAFTSPVVLEGGSVEVDGEGTCLTTRQCLLNPNRNPGMDQAAIEAFLREQLGVERVLWLDEGLLNDHTDGHIDTIARFTAPGRVVCMAPSGDDDPNAEILDAIARQLEGMRDAAGRPLEVVRVPGPGCLLTGEGEVMPASHVNFYIANHTVVVPVYGTPWDEAVVEALAPLFPGRRVVGRLARHILEGGGAFHCITQQVPRCTGEAS